MSIDEISRACIPNLRVSNAMFHTYPSSKVNLLEQSFSFALRFFRMTRDQLIYHQRASRD